MENFTKAEIERINQLYGNDFKDIAPDDALLIGRFEAAKAVKEGEYQAQVEAIKTESQLKCEQLAQQHEAAMRNLEYLHAQAVKKAEMVK